MELHNQAKGNRTSRQDVALISFQPHWSERLAPFDRLEFAASDAKGIAAAVARRAEARRDDPSAPTSEHGLDLFHTAREARGVLTRHRRRAEAAWEEAGAADAEVARAKRQGIDAPGVAQTARAAWDRAIARFERTACLESAWGRAHAALDLFGPDGRLNDRARAAVEIAAALKELTGPEWSTVRHFLSDRRSPAFLDRMHGRLAQAEPRGEWREAMAWRRWLRHRRRPESCPWRDVVRMGGRGRALSDPEQASYARVSAVLGDTSRASSAVGCMNSVLRMQQACHKRMTQPMLDLKRLYWKCCPFRSGPRKDVSPYQALGLDLPAFGFWELLQSDPEELNQRLSTSRNTE